MIGVGITVLGLHGMKVHGEVGRVSKCTKPLKWTLYLLLWAFGQIVQLLAVKLASEPVIGAVSNFAIIVNATLSARMLGERVTRSDIFAVCWMTLGSCLVVAFTPQPHATSLPLAKLEQWLGSPLSILGLLSTTLLAAAALPSALLSALRPAYRHGPIGGIAYGLLAGYMGGTSITMTKLCWLLFDEYSWHALTLGLGWAISWVAFIGESKTAHTRAHSRRAPLKKPHSLAVSVDVCCLALRSTLVPA